MEKHSTKKVKPSRPHKKNDGGCPYCDEVSQYSDRKDIRSNGYNEKHIACGKYSFYNKNNGLRYPLQNPNDKESTPYI